MQYENYRARILWGQGVVQTRVSRNTGMVGNRKNFRRPSVYTTQCLGWSRDVVIVAQKASQGLQSRGPWALTG